MKVIYVVHTTRGDVITTDREGMTLLENKGVVVGTHETTFIPGAWLEYTWPDLLPNRVAKEENDDVKFLTWQAKGRNAILNPFTTGGENPMPGRLYPNNLYIELYDDGEVGLEEWCLTIGNESEISTNLESLERKLFAYANDEGMIE